jgi:hypothetical protein
MKNLFLAITVGLLFGASPVLAEDNDPVVVNCNQFPDNIACQECFGGPVNCCRITKPGDKCTVNKAADVDEGDQPGLSWVGPDGVVSASAADDATTTIDDLSSTADDLPSTAEQWSTAESTVAPTEREGKASSAARATGGQKVTDAAQGELAQCITRCFYIAGVQVYCYDLCF